MTNPEAAVPAIFHFQDFPIREITDAQGMPWFIAKDICDILGIENSRKALERVPEHHLTSLRVTSGGQIREMNAVDEPGLYRLVLRSDKPQAEPFMEWVTAEVLPAIRKTGAYGAPAIPPDHQLITTAEYIDLLKAKVALLEGPKRKRPNRPMTEEVKETILQMFDEGVSKTEIAATLGRSKATVYYVIKYRAEAAEVQA